MKIYFTAAIYQTEELGHIYNKIVKTLEDQGNVVQHDHITKNTIDFIKSRTEEERIKHYRQVLRWITQSDIVVVEGSFPSTLNIGHEISLALEKGKPVIVLYKQGRNSFFLHGLNSDKLFLMEYTDDTLEQIVKDSIDYAKDQSDTRFNFFISPSLSHYLDWISSTKKIPRSVYLRQLIEEDREKNKEHYES